MAAHHRALLIDVFVDIVAEKKHESGILVGEMPVSREIAVLVVRAGHEAEAQTLKRRAGRRQGRGAADAACGIAAHEAVPIGPAGRQTAHVEMHRIGESLLRHCLAAPHDIVHGRVGCDLVTDRDVAASHAARRLRIDRQRFGRKSRPQYKAVRARRARGDTETERIAGPPALRRRVAQQSWGRDDSKARAGSAFEQAAARRALQV